MGALFELEGLSLVLGGAEVLSIPSLAIGEGDRLALLGPNGAGKTCLLKVLAGLLAPSSGRVLYRGSPLGRGGPDRRGAVYLHQHPYIMAGSIAYNVEFGARARGFGPAEAASRARDAMRLLGLEGFGRRAHRQLSGGEAQRVALARAIAAGGGVLLLDEPTASADASSRELIAAAIAARAASGATVVIATHDGELARGLGAKLLALDRGRVKGG